MTPTTHRLRPILLAITLGATLVLGACGSSGSDAADRPESTKPATDTSSTTKRAGGGGEATDMRGERYCEVLLLAPGDGALVARVFNSYPMNDCPDAQWQTLDAAAITAQYGSLLTNLNGPRYWAMDRVVKIDDGQPVVRETFGGIEMIQRATVRIVDPVAALKPYTVTEVNRKARFSFDADTMVYELTDPQGEKYVMQAWSQQVDPTLDEAGLADLGSRLQLPAGWTFSTRTLDAPLEIDTTESVARVIQDELRNSYSWEGHAAR